jgi:hypothetical protein
VAQVVAVMAVIVAMQELQELPTLAVAVEVLVQVELVIQVVQGE